MILYIQAVTKNSDALNSCCNKPVLISVCGVFKLSSFLFKIQYNAKATRQISELCSNFLRAGVVTNVTFTFHFSLALETMTVAEMIHFT